MARKATNKTTAAKTTEAKSPVKAENTKAATKAIATKKDTTKAIETKAGVLKDAPVVEEKAAEAKTEPKKAAKKPVAKKKAEVKTEMFLQFAGKEFTEKDIFAKVKDVWTKELKNKVGDMKDVKVYLKPEESAAYFVVNGEVSGRIEL